MEIIKNSRVFKIISIALIVAFVAPDISGAYYPEPQTNSQTLATWLANDGDPMRKTQHEIAKTLKPGAIGNGQPLIDLVRGDLPERIALDSTTEDSLREAIDLAIELYLRNRGNISPIYEDRADQALTNLYALKNELRSRVHIFNSLIQGPEDYLLGFNREGVVGLSIGLVNTLHSISPELLAQYVYHECIPEHYGRGPLTEETDREEHRRNYKELQTAIFGEEAVSQLGRIFREKIMRDVSIRERASELGNILPKWSIFQAEQLVLWNMHHSAVINENVSRDSEIVRFAEKMVVSALAVAYKLRHFMDDKKEMMVEEKSDKSLVTEVEVMVNEFLRDEFAPLGFPFVGEESEDEIDLDAIKKGTYLTVDPIDGTSNFVKMFNGELDKPALDNVTLISLVREGEPVVGICLNHYTGELDVAINYGDVRFESHIELGMLAGLDYPGVAGRERVGRLNSREALIMGSKDDDPINQKYSSQMSTAQIGGLGFRIISLSNKALQRGLVYHKKQKAGLWDLAAPNVFASLNGVTILDGDGNPLDFTQGPYFPGHGAMATKGENVSVLEGVPVYSAGAGFSNAQSGDSPVTDSKNDGMQMLADMIGLEVRETQNVLDMLKYENEIPRDMIRKINNDPRADVNTELSRLADEMLLRISEEEIDDMFTLYMYGVFFSELKFEIMREFMHTFGEKASGNTFAILNMMRISYIADFVRTEGKIDIKNQSDKDRLFDYMFVAEKQNRYIATEMAITDRKSLPKNEVQALIKAAELATKRDIHNFGPLQLHIQAKNFSKTLTGILRKNSEKTYVIAVDRDLGEGQHSQLMEIFTALDQIEKMFPNLRLVRRSGSSSSRDLSSEINTLIEKDKVDPQNIFMVVKQGNLEAKRFENLQGRAWISAIDDSAAALGGEGAYMPIFEAATISMLASINADAQAIKKVYDSIALDPETRKEITLETIENMIINRILYLLPRIEKIPLDDLRVLYERVRTVYLAA
jgi:3'-phosphoadenosine 5'-phosphosulfate (PAPS) 3'-phosphatase